ncbi:hypothetical protein [Nocardia terpenica]|uniref:Uncharacterized protein n=1 Tax=Nocardia terpenica TaxID=455432 RepID=A0A6G9Z780_9NOCA|nr:hypothetical protein [Nocardia terpenica]QIS21378.1 hypothetical protein F6W96_26625 [Nocardia terpenica]
MIVALDDSSAKLADAANMYEAQEEASRAAILRAGGSVVMGGDRYRVDLELLDEAVAAMAKFEGDVNAWLAEDTDDRDCRNRLAKGTCQRTASPCPATAPGSHREFLG